MQSTNTVHIAKIEPVPELRTGSDGQNRFGLLFAISGFTKMATIILPSDVLLDVFKFVPYENATKLVLTSKNWVKLLQVQLKEQRIAIVAEIRRLESSDLGEKHREINAHWNVLVRNEKQLCADLKTTVFNSNGIQEQTDAIDLFNQRIRAAQADRNDAYNQICANARKRKPIIDQIENLESKLDQCGESETERFAELERRKKRYSTALYKTGKPARVDFGQNPGLRAPVTRDSLEGSGWVMAHFACLIESYRFIYHTPGTEGCAKIFLCTS
ncbi:hypothetical protein Ddc_24068 [Ditylenchus destructor]|nr:hypothetical protein Ddc_24068 [Ditylenchus destructor]